MNNSDYVLMEYYVGCDLPRTTALCSDGIEKETARLEECIDDYIDIDRIEIWKDGTCFRVFRSSRT